MKRTLITLLLALPISATAQINLKNGYVVKNSGDTVKGYVNFKERSQNPKSVNFRIQPNGLEQAFTIRDCKAFAIDKFESYRRAVVKISLSDVQIGHLSSGVDTSSKTDTVFLKILADGKNVTLYSYTDKIKKRFYIQDKNSSVANELIRNVYNHPSDGKLVITDNVFAKQLKEIIEKYGAQTEVASLEGVKYSDKELKTIVYAINKKEYIDQKIKATRFFSGVGLNVSKGYYKGNIDFTNEAAMVKTSYFPMITGGVDLFANPNTKKLVYRVELSLLISKNEISTTTNDVSRAAISHSFNQFTVALTPQLLYNFYNADKLKVFGTLGAALNFSSYSNNVSSRTNSFRNETTVTPNEVKIESFNFAPQATAGVVLNNKIEISAGYSLPSIIASFAAYDLYMKRYRLGINYFFGKSN